MGLSRDHDEFEVRKYLSIVSTVAEYIAFNERYVSQNLNIQSLVDLFIYLRERLLILE